MVIRLQDNQTNQLPSFCVNQSRPFQYTGVDFTGPLHIRNGKEEKKAYITLFTCAVTRAVHMELAKDLTAAEFGRNLKKFVARRGTPNLLVSDNAATFKAVSVDLEETYNHPEVREYLDEIYLQWRFNLVLAAWWGGFFERIVGLVKAILRGTLGKAKLGFKELEVILAKTAAILNNRPLTYQGDDLEEEPLSSNHLIYGCKLPQMVEEPEDYFDEQVDLDRRRKYVGQKLSNVWNRWHREYLVGLKEDHKVKMDQGYMGHQIEVGDIVITEDKQAHRGMWKMGKVIRLVNCGVVTKGAVMEVVVKGRKVLMERPLNQLCLMELKSEVSSKEEKDKVPILLQPARKAAHDTKKRIKNQAKELFSGENN